VTAVTTTELFDSLERQQHRQFLRFEINCATFNRLRRGVRELSGGLKDGDSTDQTLSETLTALLCSWLTTPVPFPAIHEELRAVLPAPDISRSRWSRSLSATYMEVLAAAQELASTFNPLPDSLRRCWEAAKASGQNSKIYCHRKAQDLFIQVLQQDGLRLSDDTFIHSPARYKQSELFDCLIKVGPLRAFGWGSVPDALFTAPRFNSLHVFAWKGCEDDSGFGYDPAAGPISTAPATNREAVNCYSPISWVSTKRSIGTDDDILNFRLSDELGDYRASRPEDARRSTTLVSIESSQGLLYPRHSKALSFDSSPIAAEPVDLRVPGEALCEGMFIIEPVISEVDLGSVAVVNTKYSQKWKAKLARMNEEDSFGLFFKLSDAGIDLGNLASAIDNWCRPPSTVIHAPRETKHFEILIKAIGMNDTEVLSDKGKPLPFWRVAWDEIKRSRGRAIQAGFDENEIVAEELRDILRRQISDLRARANERVRFDVLLPADTGIRGHCTFHPIFKIEEGFRAPQSAIRVILPLEDFEQWQE
jgi:hypothetical protein